MRFVIVHKNTENELEKRPKLNIILENNLKVCYCLFIKKRKINLKFKIR